MLTPAEPSRDGILHVPPNEPSAAPLAAPSAGSPTRVASHFSARMSHLAVALPKLLFESLLILLSVLAAFGVNEYRDRQADRRNAELVVQNFRHEVEQNLAALEDGYRRETEFARQLSAVDVARQPTASAVDLVARALPPGGLRLPVLSDAAWETSLATNGLHLVDYGTVSLLSQTYLLQRTSVSGSTKLVQDAIFDRRSFTPSDTRATVRLLLAIMQQLTAQEQVLIERYRTVLARLPGAPPAR